MHAFIRQTMLWLLLLPASTASTRVVNTQDNKPASELVDPAPGEVDPDFCDPDVFKWGMKVIQCPKIEDEVCGFNMKITPYFLEDQARCTNVI